LPNTGWHDRDDNERVIILKGEAILSFTDGSSISLKTGDYINILAHNWHKVTCTDPDIETIWLAVHY
jgi:cupin 2 domain-containing protein